MTINGATILTMVPQIALGLFNKGKEDLYTYPEQAIPPNRMHVDGARLAYFLIPYTTLHNLFYFYSTLHNRFTCIPNLFLTSLIDTRDLSYL